MILVDTSVWVLILRDKTGDVTAAFRERIGSESVVLSRFNQLELLQGARDISEWRQLDEYLATQVYLEASAETWRNAARIYFDLRREGITVGSPVDCCLAQIAIESGALLLHFDRDFQKIARVRRLDEEYFSPAFSS
ncbi:MAG: VapC toxin family PIN domain ribonuclease [Desulfobacteraceae bacterium CG2_30_51_40]|nr:MAG: VapC toxin family PIN domain ribonuclease [Desulfobacteraceae bacterium CG2_30_51_40]